MGILTSPLEPCHLKIQEGPLASPLRLPSGVSTKKAPGEKKVSFNHNVKVQVFEIENSCSDDDCGYLLKTEKSFASGRARMPKRSRRRKPKAIVQRVLAQQAKELRESGYVNPYSLADVSLMTSSIFAAKAHMVALHCAIEVDEYLVQSDMISSSSESEASDFEDILL
mmetsp:Transcript_40362/g.97466  ORF Transcript_40362/g.97466 Transcript_40362/m.97466 type:complete len:168 (-) Transcript_40362:193-696(-)|eukprot:CAMPEP_0113609712 /NCGR_PEP_ID=MMETSP0017_2-20120614/4640_1 /TAXON_ID=2856 /ORGANISM="Cylindrotheca closterium" /LENGTH=167 /DNA_ID=CAMNT_0000518553 /DNA_START=68 /DNA_END=571 /DNA_ORIENTATION=- /assembly_acc=CAM_ASM_000147